MTKDEFLALAARRYDDLQRLNTEQTNFYDYDGLLTVFEQNGHSLSRR